MIYYEHKQKVLTMNQKVSTGLGTAILLVMAFTAGYFVWMIERNNHEQEYVPNNISLNKLTNPIPLKQNEKQGAGEQIVPDSSKTTSWTSYQDSNLDVVFQYPNSWVLSTADTNFGADDFEIKFTRNSEGFNDDIRILGNKSLATQNDAIQSYFGECAQGTKGLKQFCADGNCVEINEHTKVRYEAPMMGERVFIAYIYTDLSNKYPNLCVEATLGEMHNIVGDTREYFDDGNGGYNVRAYIDNNAINENMRNFIADLTKFAGSISKK